MALIPQNKLKVNCVAKEKFLVEVLKQNFCKVGHIAQIIWQIISLFILIARGVNMFLLLVFVKVPRTTLADGQVRYVSELPGVPFDKN